MKKDMQLKPNEISTEVSFEQFEARTKEIYDRVVKPQVEALQGSSIITEIVQLTATQVALADCHNPY